MAAAMAAEPAGAGSDERALADLLGHRYGDGLVYLREAQERGLLRTAMARGLVSREGYLTPAGRSLLARFDSG